VAVKIFFASWLSLSRNPTSELPELVAVSTCVDLGEDCTAQSAAPCKVSQRTLYPRYLLTRAKVRQYIECIQQLVRVLWQCLDPGKHNAETPRLFAPSCLLSGSQGCRHAAAENALLDASLDRRSVVQSRNPPQPL